MNSLPQTEFSIKYQTAEVVPPPFSHAIEINGIAQNQVGDSQLSIKFELTYLDRKTLSLEEIEEEGFTENDDFSWSGTLNKGWNDIIFGNILSSKTLNISNLEEIQDFWQISAGEKSFYPKNTDEWKYLLEELQQAIFEKAGRELPMKLTFLKIEPNQKTCNELQASFEKRELKLVKTANDKTILLKWNELNYYLKHIFSADFNIEIAETKRPTRNGTYLNTGDDYWYEFGKSLKGNYKKIEQLFTNN